MPESPQKTTKKKLVLRNLSFKKLNRSYDFLMRHDETKKEILGFKLNLLNLILVIIGLALLLIVINTFIIAFTPLREYIPGYADTDLNREVYELNLRADSINRELQKKDIYFENLKRIVEGYDFESDSTERYNIYEPLPHSVTDTITLKKSVQDSLLRAEFEAQSQYNLFGDNPAAQAKRQAKNFLAPIDGSLFRAYDPSNGHFGIDIVSGGSQVIKATYDGTVVFSTWSFEDSYCIGIQHEDGYFSTYRHNATLLKKEGDSVKSGEAIAILGKSGKSDEQPYLHFELWHNGVSVNPAEYVMIEK